MAQSVSDIEQCYTAGATGSHPAEASAPRGRIATAPSSNERLHNPATGALPMGTDASSSLLASNARAMHESISRAESTTRCAPPCAPGEHARTDGEEAMLEEHKDIRSGPALANGLRFAILPLPLPGPRGRRQSIGESEGLKAEGGGRVPGEEEEQGGSGSAGVAIILKLHVGALDEEPLQKRMARRLARAYRRRWREGEKARLESLVAGVGRRAALVVRCGLRSISLRLSLHKASSAKGGDEDGRQQEAGELACVLRSLRDLVFGGEGVGEAGISGEAGAAGSGARAGLGPARARGAAAQGEAQDPGAELQGEGGASTCENRGRTAVSRAEAGLWEGRKEKEARVVRLLHRETLVPAR